MALEDILMRIRDESQKEAEAIVSSAEENAAKRLQDAQTRADEIAHGILSSAQERSREVMNAARTRATSRKRQAILLAKQKILTKVFEEALLEIKNLPKDSYVDLLLDILKSSAQGDEEILLSEEDKGKTQGFSDKANALLKEAGKPPVTVTYAKESLGGGFILKRGKIAVNNTFPAVFSQIRDELEVEIAELLFQKEV